LKDLRTSALPEGQIVSGGTAVWEHGKRTSSHTNFEDEDEIWGSTDVEVKEAPGRPLEYGETFPGREKKNESG
jgi:hypothetical protein